MNNHTSSLSSSGFKLRTSHRQKPQAQTTKLKKSNHKDGTTSQLIRNKINVSHYNRIIPKRAYDEPQHLYTENLQLRDRLKLVEDMNMKLKTKMVRVQKQKQLLNAQVQNSQNYFSIYRNQKKQKSLPHRKQTNKHNQQNRRILFEHKQKIQKLSNQNMKLKKSIKFVEIQEKEVENKLIFEELTRLKDYIIRLQAHCENTNQNEEQLKKVKKQIQSEKGNAKMYYNQVKKQEEQLESLRQKLKGLTNRKIELDKKHNREIQNLKVSLQYTKEKQRQMHLSMMYEKQQSSKKKSSPCNKCPQHISENKSLKSKQEQLAIEKDSKEDEIKSLKSELQNLRQENSKIKENESRLLFQKQNMKKVQVSESKYIPVQNEKEKQKSQNKIIKEKNHEVALESDGYNEYNEDDLEQIYLNDPIKQQKANKEENKNVIKDSESENTENLIQDVDSGDEVIFKKQQTPQKFQKYEVQEQKKGQQTQKSKKEDKSDKVNKKTYKILKQTITYRLFYHRYTYQNFENDIRDSKQKKFTDDEVFEMLTNQPFYLAQPQLNIILPYCFGNQTTLSAKKFLKKMLNFIGEINLLEESEEEHMRKKIQKSVKKKAKQLHDEFESISSQSTVSKKDFVKILKQVGLMNEDEIDCCLCEASVVSNDISHIDYGAFLNKILT